MSASLTLFCSQFPTFLQDSVSFLRRFCNTSPPGLPLSPCAHTQHCAHFCCGIWHVALTSLPEVVSHPQCTLQGFLFMYIIGDSEMFLN